MKLVVGLGNPGEKYERTRHNAGFWFIERFAAQTGTAMRKDARFQALVGRHQPSGVWFLLPQNFMNASGKAVQMLAGFFKIAPDEILVVHDELDFAPGLAKIKKGGGIAGHNGLRDISARLGSHDYWRLRIGIGHPGDRQAVTDYVLHKPGQDERAEIDAAIGRALEVLPIALAGDMQGAMLKLHTQEKPLEKAKAAEAIAQPVKADKTAMAERPQQPVPSAGNDKFPAAEATAGPDRPKIDKPAAAEKPQPAFSATSSEPAAVAAAEHAAGAEKLSALKSLFRKFVPGTKKQRERR